MGDAGPGRKRWKICHVHLLSMMSGPQHSTIELFKQLPPDQYESHVVMASPGEEEFQAELESLGIQVHHCNHLVRTFSPIDDVRAFLELRSLFRREAYDLVHTHSSKTGILGRLAARAAGVPAIVHHVRGFSFHEFSSRPTRLGGGVLEGFAARVSDRVIFVNEEERVWSEKYRVVPKGRASTIRNGADLRRFSPDERERLRGPARAEFGIAPDQVAIAFIGRLWEQKNPTILIPTLLEILRGFPALDPVLLVAGDGPLRESVEQAVNDRGVSARVRFLGWRQDVPSVISAADVVYLPSLWEGLPRTLIEAACLGVPAVASDVKGNREVVAQDETGVLVVPNDVPGSAQALGDLLTEPERLAEFGSAAALRGRRLYNTRDTARRIESIYQDLLPERKPAPVLPESGKVLFFSHYFPPEGNAPASRVHAICSRWVKRGWRVKVITCAPNVPNGKVYAGYRNQLTQREKIDGIEVIRVWTMLAPNEGVTLRILNYVSYMFSATIRALFEERPDVIIATSPQFFCGWAGVLSKWLRRRPLILEIRDIWPESIVAVGAMKRRWLLRGLEWLERRMYGASDRIVAVGEGYRDQLVLKQVPSSTISIVPNGVDRRIFSPLAPDLELRERLELDGKFVCSYVGTIGMASGLDVVLRASRMLKRAGRDEIVFLLVGDGAVRAELETVARREGLDGVRFVGRQDKDRVPAFFSVSDCCLVHLRSAELFKTVLPSKIFEALAMKTPVIGGVEGHAARVIEVSGGGLAFEPENEAALVRVLDHLRSAPEVRNQMARDGYDYVLENYDMDRLSADYLDLLQKVVPASQSTGRPYEAQS